MSREKRQQMRCHPNRTNTRPTTTVRDAEGLVQIEVADISPKGARPAEPNLSVQIGSIEIDLPTVLMHERTDFSYTSLKHAMR
jgi:hypothetical protein